ncbi:MAG: Gfo/Idh/MocA family oxidoreductase [Spirochaetaceae bacterium]|jgi:predicted dehydrogenase|nr:Gfo/Idh/MocA family oxidoreductase [Spirochaetaceae bacterium]
MIKVGIIGAGSISRLHIEGYNTFPKLCKITALADIHPQDVQKRKKEYAFLEGAKEYASHIDMLNGSEVDLVSICTPPFTHAAIAVDCLNAGKNVLVEKPMAASLSECDLMLAAAKKSGRLLSSVAQNRFKDPILNLKRVLDSGAAGKVLHAQVDSHWWRGRSYYDLWWRGLWEKEGGGCTLNHAVHHIDMLGWMLGPPASVTAVMSNAAHDNAEVEDVSIAIMSYGEGRGTAKGALAQVTSSVIHYGEEQQLIFQCEKARISAPWKAASHVAQDNGFPDRSELSEPFIAELNALYASFPPLDYTGHTGQVNDVLKAVEEKRPPFITGEDGRLTIELITSIYKAAIEGRRVSFPVNEGDSFYTARGIQSSAPRFHQKKSSAESLDGKITTGASYK